MGTSRNVSMEKQNALDYTYVLRERMHRMALGDNNPFVAYHYILSTYKSIKNHQCCVKYSGREKIKLIKALQNCYGW